MNIIQQTAGDEPNMTMTTHTFGRITRQTIKEADMDNGNNGVVLAEGDNLSCDGMALLLGVNRAAVKALGELGGTSRTLPEAWIESGRARSREARAATGEDDMLSSLIYWAMQDHGMAVSQDGVTLRLVEDWDPEDTADGDDMPNSLVDHDVSTEVVLMQGRTLSAEGWALLADVDVDDAKATLADGGPVPAAWRDQASDRITQARMGLAPDRLEQVLNALDYWSDSDVYVDSRNGELFVTQRP
jgi:hypothetical protein